MPQRPLELATRVTLLLSLLVAPALLAEGISERIGLWNGGIVSGEASAPPESAAVGPSGDLYVASSLTTSRGSRWGVSRTGPAGDVQWFWTGPDEVGGSVSGLALSGTGDVLVTGSLDGECGLVRLSADGVLLWQVRHPWSFASGCSELAVDGAGRPYVASSEGSIQVVAWDVDGSLRWRGTVPNALPSPTALEVVGDTLFVAGPTAFDATSDFLVAALDLDDGDVLWSTRWDGAGASDSPKALAVLDDHVFVAGRSDHPDSGADFTVVRFDLATGAAERQRRIDRGAAEEAADLAVLGPDLLVSGLATDSGTEDLMLMRLDTALRPVWGRVIDDGGDEPGLFLDVSADGSVIAVAGSARVHSFDADGHRSWTTDLGAGHSVHGLVAEPSGIRAAGRQPGDPNTDLLVLRLDSDGEELWRVAEPDLVETTDGHGSVIGVHDGRADVRRHAATALGEGVVVAANSAGLGPALLSVTPDGSIVDLSSGNPVPSQEVAAAVAHEPGGPVVLASIAGETPPLTVEDVVLRGFDPEGAQIFSTTVEVGTTTSQSLRLVAHPDGGTVLGASSLASPDHWDLLVVRIDSLGSVLWSRQIDRGESMDDELSGLEIDAAGRILLAGTSRTDEDSGCLVLALDGDGDELWRRMLDELFGEDEDCGDLAVLPGGPLAVTIHDHDFVGGEPMLRALDPETGADLWSTPNDAADPLQLVFVAPGPGGDLLGFSEDPAGIVRVRSDGVLLWRTASGLPRDQIRSIVWDALGGRVVVSGAFGDRVYSAAGGLLSSAPAPGLEDNDPLWIEGAGGELFRVSTVQTPDSHDILVGRLSRDFVFLDGFETGDAAAWD